MLCLGAAATASAVEAARLEPGAPQPELPGARPAQEVEDQLVRGRVAYGLNCISCHAGRLQGLTDEWRAQWDPDHQDCWKSKCHSFNHPPDGFIIPRWAPPLREEMLANYANAADLFNYISVAMPFQEPGVLSDEKYWDIEAYILYENGLRWGKEPLGPENAPEVPLSEPVAGEAERPPAAVALEPAGTPTVIAAPPVASREGNRARLGAALSVVAIGLLAAGGGWWAWRKWPKD